MNAVEEDPDTLMRIITALIIQVCRGLGARNNSGLWSHKSYLLNNIINAEIAS
jgi:hypothetical protein